MTEGSCLLWFRQDLRLEDNPALNAALQHHKKIIPIYIWSAEDDGPWAPGAASRWWLHQSLESLDQSLQGKGSRLIIRRGPPLEILQALIQATGAKSVFWNRRYEPENIKLDSNIKTSLSGQGVGVESFNSSLLIEPWEIKTGAGKPFQVYTPFWNACGDRPQKAVLAAPKTIPAPAKWPVSLELDSLGLEPKHRWADGFKTFWKPGEIGAKKNMKSFLESHLNDYSEGRDRPYEKGTSRLSPHLHFGEIGPRQIWHALEKAGDRSMHFGKSGRTTYLKEIYWREFATHLLFHFPQTPTHPLREKFAKFPWKKDPRTLKAWQKGMTGFPLIDAGMRELWATGWMHNRVRMVVSSFLTKDLGLSWVEGARWFWETLVDADLANNTFGWQWSAGCGADAAPFFRIFNPTRQGERFDPEGTYVKTWVPELKHLPAKWIHHPWDAPPELLASAGMAVS